MFGEKIYLVQAHFGDSDNYYVIPIGVFIDQQIACKIAHKWEDFFTKTKIDINKIPDGIDDGEIDWDEIHIKYAEVEDFKEITVKEFELNTDSFPEFEYRTDDYISKVKQWDRDYKISTII